MLEQIEDLGTRLEGKTRRRWAKYKCSFCENVFEKRVSNANAIDNCGCQTSQRKANPKHGMSDMKQLVYAHSDMKKRCNTATHKSYHRYGGRGITYCKEWKDFETFALWSLENGFTEGIGLSIDRINVDGNYEPSNCRWIPRGQNTSLASTIYTIEQIEDARLLFNQGYKGKYIEEATGVKAISLHSILNHQRKWK
jgi:hypothetical protein